MSDLLAELSRIEAMAYGYTVDTETRQLILRMAKALRIQHEKLEHIQQVCDSPQFRAVFQSAAIHGMTYTGGQFGIADAFGEAFSALRGTEE